MAALPSTPFNPDRYVVIHVATTCDEHGVYVTKDSAEVIEIGWILVDAKTLEEVRRPVPHPTDRLRRRAVHVHVPSRAAQKLTLHLCPTAAPREHPRQACQHAHHPSLQ